MNKQAIRDLFKRLEKEYGLTEQERFMNYYYLRGKKKIFIINKPIEIEKKEREGIHIISEEPFGLRLTIEGSQMFGPFLTKKVIELNREQFLQYLRGKDLEIETPYKKEFVVLKYNNIFLGSGLAYPNKIINYLPKARRI